MDIFTVCRSLAEQNDCMMIARILMMECIFLLLMMRMLMFLMSLNP